MVSFAKRIFLLILLILPFLFTTEGFAQHYGIGMPFITSFGEKDFNVSSQNWDVVQDSRQVMYFANDYGVLEFDGSNWNIIQVPDNRSVTRSLAFGSNHRLYAGGQDFIGYIDSGDSALNMNSLADMLPPGEQNFGTIWKIFNVDNKMIFFSWNALFIFDGQSFKIIKADQPFKTCFKVGKRIFIHGDKLYELKGDSLKSLPASDYMKDRNIAFISDISENNLLIAFDDGEMVTYDYQTVTPFSLSDKTLLKENKFLCGIRLKNNLFLAGTSDNGLIVFDKSGRVHKHITKSDGLGHNHIKQVFEDDNGNWWILNENGIDIVEASSPFYRISVDPENPLSVYSSFHFKDRIYAATHSGLYVAPWNNYTSNPVFKRVPGVGDICWNLDTLGGNLYLSNGDGLYRVENELAVNIYNGTPVWTLIRLPQHPDVVLAGTYEGLALFKRVNGTLQFVKKLKGYSETSRVAAVDNEGNVWISHGFKGVFKITLSDAADSILNVEFYNSNKGFPSNLFINVFKINGEIIFGTQLG
ncbi:MAG TPA: hypothetical protein VE912_14945, partial [Bacteroidales bacterium]|nr:hypothetical protein [Bacteroidales bacterium]